MCKNIVKVIIVLFVNILLMNYGYSANLTTNNSDFDTSVDSYTALSDNVDYILSQHINGPLSAIVNIENILGTGLKGTQATLSARLSQMISGAGGINSGTSYPTNPTPVNAQLFWRSDLKALYIYDGALGQWQQLQIPSTFSFSSPSAFTLTLYHNITAGRTITFPDATDTLVGKATTDTLTNKTLTSPVISTIVNTGTLTLPTSTDTLVGRTTTDTLTNKAIDDASNTLTILEASITDGSLLARLAAAETVTGNWQFAPSTGTKLQVSDWFSVPAALASAPVTATGTKRVDIGRNLSLVSDDPGVGMNAYWDGANWVYSTTDSAFLIRHNQASDQLQLDYAAAGTQGTAISFVTGFSMNTLGQLGVSNTTKVTNLNADLLDDLNAGNASGNIPISNGTVNTNLNADMVDGYHAGNASGNVPVSNGTVNTNLNADMVDGYHATSIAKTSIGSNIFTSLPSGSEQETLFSGLTGINGYAVVQADAVDWKVSYSYIYRNNAGDMSYGKGGYGTTPSDPTAPSSNNQISVRVRNNATSTQNVVGRYAILY